MDKSRYSFSVLSLWVPLILSISLAIVFVPVETAVCNEAVCASVVSKCMLTQSCKCDLTHCSCCKDCYSCLSYLYNECCSCVDMCPGTVAEGSPIGHKSYVEEFPDGVPGLFAALTAEPDSLKRWRPMSIPLDRSLQNVDGDPMKSNSLAVNCTVAYMSQCMSWSKCKASCQTMGSSSFRWFQDGCCECIGDTCSNYGLDESRCLACGEGGHLEEEPLEDVLDYGEDMDPQPSDSYS